jgi:cob(I)alamin adenosyltransferase
MSEDDTKGLVERHKARMRRKKAVVNEKMQAAQRDAGLLVVLTGNGKGKSSSGFGMVARALGHGLKAGVVQFIKGAIPTGPPLSRRGAVSHRRRRLHVGDTGS